MKKSTSLLTPSVWLAEEEKGKMQEEIQAGGDSDRREDHGAFLPQSFFAQNRSEVSRSSPIWG